MSDSPRRSLLGELSWFQVAAGALAAMTSAWLASALGVGGTIVGAALGSLVVAVSSSFYANTLDKGRTLIVQTDDGRRVRASAEPGETAEVLSQVEESTGSAVRGAEVVDDPPGRVRWKLVALTTAVILAVSGLAMGAYELVTDRAYGSDPDNARIGNPFGGGSSSSQDDAPEPTATPSDETPAEPEADPEETAEPEPTEVTPTPAPTATPTPTATVPAPTATPQG